MAVWTTPKTDWDEDDLIIDTDLNRIEENIEYLYDEDINTGGHLRNYISGFEVNANSWTEGLYEVKVKGGIWSDSAGNFVDWGDVTYTKTLSAANWTAGDAGEALLDAASFVTNKWYWVFALYNPTTGLPDFALDDNALGTNLGPATTAGYTLSRRICAVRTSTEGAANSIIPMRYDSNSREITYAGWDAPRKISKALTAGVPLAVPLQNAAGYTLYPYDAVNTIAQGGVFEIDAESSGTARVTMWNSNYFGATYYVGIGQPHYFAGASDRNTYRIQAPLGFVYLYSTNSVTVSIVVRSMTYDTNIIP